MERSGPRFETAPQESKPGSTDQESFPHPTMPRRSVLGVRRVLMGTRINTSSTEVPGQ